MLELRPHGGSSETVNKVIRRKKELQVEVNPSTGKGEDPIFPTQ